MSLGLCQVSMTGNSIFCQLFLLHRGLDLDIWLTNSCPIAVCRAAPTFPLTGSPHIPTGWSGCNCIRPQIYKHGDSSHSERLSLLETEISNSIFRCKHMDPFEMSYTGCDWKIQVLPPNLNYFCAAATKAHTFTWWSCKLWYYYHIGKHLTKEIKWLGKQK